MSINGASLQPDNKTPVLVQGEKLFYSQDGVRFEFEGAGGGMSYASKTGSLYLTNLRMVYVLNPLLDHLKTFNVPLENLKDGKFIQPWFDANRYEGTVIPVPHGGLRERGIMKLTFKEGGGFEFSSIFQQLRSRITGEPTQYENLPAYEEPAASSSSSLAEIQPVGASSRPVFSVSPPTEHPLESSISTPLEAPPGYDFAVSSPRPNEALSETGSGHATSSTSL
ncbi:hypothetical protein SeLEV6574_g06853 [Synchytrium endobioticum]|uniref:GRAM domain-containing protein n=1 Tax=Synchytrium endobioticum TaxID=286115 RepID=A0A507CMQ5_9FUNG|nr:hypothetical protein SeLEV6574_g06853 [Synchytrium endobioticum]